MTELRSVFQGRLAGCSPFWPEVSDWPDLTDDEFEEIRKLAERTASRVQVPLHAMDIGQLENGQWIVVEIGDLQSAGLIETDRETLVREILRGPFRWS
mgnify:CR=1 FL=1